MKPDGRIIKRAVIDLEPGDMLIGRQGGRSVVEDTSDQSGLLGFMRIGTEHGYLYMELDTEVRVIPHTDYPEIVIHE